MANLDFDSLISEQSIFKIGEVVSVNGREVRINVDKEKNLPHLFYKGELIKNVSVGSYFKILNGFDVLIAKIEAEFIEKEKEDNKSNYNSPDSLVKRFLLASLIGFISHKRFIKGVKKLPLVGNDVYILNPKEFNTIHSFVEDSKDRTIRIGTLSSDDRIIVSLSIQKLFSSHIGIFGNTGSGKSYTLAQVYKQLFDSYKGKETFKNNSRFLFIDFNGEYSGDNVMTDKKTSYKLSTTKQKDRIPMKKDSVMDLDTLCIFASATEKTQRPFINRALNLYHWIENKGANQEDRRQIFIVYLRKIIKSIFYMEDKSKIEPLLEYLSIIIPAELDDNGLQKDLRESVSYHETGKYYYLTEGENNPYKRRLSDRTLSNNNNGELIEKTAYYIQAGKYEIPSDFISFFIHILYVKLIEDVKNNRAQNDHIHPAIQKLKSMVNNISKVFNFTDEGDFWDGNNIVVVDLRYTNQDTKKMIPLLLCHSAYKNHTQQESLDSPYLNIIIDEAHNILSYQSTRESDSWKDYRLEVFEEIIKEGRKFGVFMTIASQRPSDISSTIVSQLHNYFIHRLVNEEDLSKVSKTISYLDKVSQETLPILSTGACVIAGQVSEMPVIVQVDKMDDKNKPNNETIILRDFWD